MTIREALLTSQSSLSSCVAVKELAQDHRRGMSDVPAEVSTVLYYAAIAAGLCHHRRLITSLSREGLDEGLAWCGEQAWVGRDIHELCTNAREILDRYPAEDGLGPDAYDPA